MAAANLSCDRVFGSPGPPPRNCWTDHFRLVTRRWLLRCLGSQWRHLISCRHWRRRRPDHRRAHRSKYRWRIAGRARHSSLAECRARVEWIPCPRLHVPCGRRPPNHTADSQRVSSPTLFAHMNPLPPLHGRPRWRRRPTLLSDHRSSGLPSRINPRSSPRLQ